MVGAGPEALIAWQGALSPRPMKRTALILFALATAVGLAGGLYYSWVVAPSESVDSRPDALRSRDKTLYLALIGDAYAYERDLAGAKAHLNQLGLAADGPTLAGVIEAYLDGGGQPDQVRNLARLAEALGGSGGVLLVFAPEPTAAPATTEPVSATDPVRAPASPAPTTSPTPVASPTPAPTFQLVERTALCAAPGKAGHITVWIQDAQGQPLPGIEIVVSWSTGQDRFYTGLRPERGAGYADFEMAPATNYEVYLADYRGDVAPDLTSSLQSGLCQPGVEAIDWRLVFQQSP
jgi:hypothetical protein